MENIIDVQTCVGSIHKNQFEYKNSYDDKVSSMHTHKDIADKDINDNYKLSYLEINTEKNSLINAEEFENEEFNENFGNLRNDIHEDMSSMEINKIDFNRNKSLIGPYHNSADHFKKLDFGFIDSLLKSPNRDLNTSKIPPSSLAYLNLFDLDSSKAYDPVGFKNTFNNSDFEIDKIEKLDSFNSENNANNNNFNSSSQSQTSRDIVTKFLSGENKKSNMVHTNNGLQKCEHVQNIDRESSIKAIALKQNDNSLSPSSTNKFSQKVSSYEYIDCSVSSSDNISHKILNENKCANDLVELKENVNKQDKKVFVYNFDIREEIALKNVNDILSNAQTNSLSKNEMATKFEYKFMANENSNEIEEYRARVDEIISFDNESNAEYKTSLQDHDTNDEKDCSFENIYLNPKDSKFYEKDILVSLDDVLVRRKEHSIGNLCQQELRSLSDLNTKDDYATSIDFRHTSIFENIFYNANTFASPDVPLTMEENQPPLIDHEMSSYVNLRSPVVSSVNMSELYNSPLRYQFSPVSSRSKSTLLWTTQSPIPAYNSLFSPFQMIDSLEDCLQTPDTNNSADSFDENKNRSMDSIEHLLDEYLVCLNDSVKVKPNHEIYNNENKCEKIIIEKGLMSAEKLLKNVVNNQDLNQVGTINDGNFVEMNDQINSLSNKFKDNVFESSILHNISTIKEPLSKIIITNIESNKIGERIDKINKDSSHNKSSFKASNTPTTSNVEICTALNEAGLDLDTVIQSLFLEPSKETQSHCVGDIHTNDFENNIGMISCGKDTRPEESILSNGCKELGIIPLNKKTKFSVISPKHPIFIKPTLSKEIKCDKSIVNQYSSSKEHSSLAQSSIHQLKKQPRKQLKKKDTHLRHFSISTFLRKVSRNASSDTNVNIKKVLKENLGSKNLEKIVLSTGSCNLLKKNKPESFHTHHKIIYSSEEKTKCLIRLARKPIKCMLAGRVIENVKSCSLRSLKFINGSDKRFYIQDGSGSWPEREEFHPNSFSFPVKNTVTNIENTLLNPRPNPKLPLPPMSSFISQYAKKKKSPQITGGCVGRSTSTQNIRKAVVYPIGKTGISITIPTGIVSQHNVMPFEGSISTSSKSKLLNANNQKILQNGENSQLLCKLQKARVSNKSKKVLQQHKPITNKLYTEKVNHPLILPKIKAFNQPLQVLLPSLNPKTTVNVPLTMHNVALQSSNILELKNSKNVGIQTSSLTSPLSMYQVSLAQSIPNNALCLMVPSHSGYSMSKYVLDKDAKNNLKNTTNDSTILGENISRQDIPTKILPNMGILGNLTPICSIFQKPALSRTKQNYASSFSLRLFESQEKNNQVTNAIKTNKDHKTRNKVNEIDLVPNNTNKVQVDLSSTSEIVQHLRRQIFKRKPYPDSINHKVRDLLRDDLKLRFPGISDGILEQLSIPPQVLHRGYFSVRDLKIIQNQIISLQLDSIFEEHVSVCSIQNCQLCLKYEKQKKALLLAEREQRLGTRVLNNSKKLNLSKGRGRGRGRSRIMKGLEDEPISIDKDPTYKSPIGSEKRKVSEHHYMESFDKKQKFTEIRRLYDENKTTEHRPNCSLHLIGLSRKRSSSESNVSNANIKVTCFGSCDDSCIKEKSCKICRFCSKDSIYTEKNNDTVIRTSSINFIKELLENKGPSCSKKIGKNLEKNELCISKYKKNLQLKAKIDKEFPPFSENYDSEPNQKGVTRNLPRPLYLDLHSLQVGSNILEADYQQQLTPKLRIIYSARKFVYEFKLNDGDIDQHTNQNLPMLLVIDVPFKSVRALSIAANKVLLCVDTVPWVGVLGRRRACRVVMPNPLMTEAQQKRVTLIKAALTIHPVHKLILPDQGRALAMYNGLSGVFSWFHRALKQQFPVLEAVNPTWNLKSQIDMDQIVEHQLNPEGYARKVSCGKNKKTDLNLKEYMNTNYIRSQKKQVHEEFITISPKHLIDFSCKINESLNVYDIEKDNENQNKNKFNKRNVENVSNTFFINPDTSTISSFQAKNMKINSPLSGTVLIPSTVSSGENINTGLNYSQTTIPDYGPRINQKQIIDHCSNLKKLNKDTSQILSSMQIQSSNKIVDKDESTIIEGKFVKCSQYFGAIGEELAKLINERDQPVTSNMLSQAVKAVISTQVHSSSFGMQLPTLLPQGCNCCEGTCRSMTCPCALAGALCHTSARCGCNDCVNPLNVLTVLNIDVNASRMDECLMQNLYNFDMMGLCEVLLKVIPLPCCGRSLEVRFLLPGTVLCIYCGCALSFSWCLGWPSLQAVTPRNHCLVCCSCQPPLHTHCQMCGQCTRSTALGVCTTCGNPKLFVV